MKALRSVDATTALNRAREEVWSARRLMPILGYDTWDQLTCVIEKAKFIAQVQGFEPTALFVRVIDELDDTPQEDFLLKRHAAYLLASASDMDIPSVAETYNYFAPTIRKDT